MNLRDSKVDTLSTKNPDMKGRRVVNASNAQDLQDYVTLSDLTTRINEIDFTVPPSSNNVDVLIQKMRPMLEELFIGGTARGRVLQNVADTLSVSLNLNFDGTNWILDDATIVGWLLVIDSNGFAFSYWPVAGALTPLATLDSTGFNLLLGGYQYGILAGFSGAVTLAKLTALGTVGFLTVTHGLVTAYVPPT